MVVYQDSQTQLEHFIITGIPSESQKDHSRQRLLRLILQVLDLYCRRQAFLSRRIKIWIKKECYGPTAIGIAIDSNFAFSCVFVLDEILSSKVNV